MNPQGIERILTDIMLAITRKNQPTTDANGWRVTPLGNGSNIYTRRFSVSSIAATTSVVVAGPVNLPVGKDLNSLRFSLGVANSASFVEYITAAIQASASSTSFYLFARNTGGGATGVITIDVTFTDA